MRERKKLGDAKLSLHPLLLLLLAEDEDDDDDACVLITGSPKDAADG